MDIFFRRLTSKKGFTLVELIVVIAIIGVLAAMILPNMLQSDIPVKAKGYAKDYYFTAQEFFSRQKIAADNKPENSPFYLNPTASLEQVSFYTKLNAAGRIESNGILTSNNTTMITAGDYKDMTANENLKKLVAEYDSYMNQHLTTGERAGYLYCVLDNHYRVQVTYWSEESVEKLAAADSTLTFKDDYIIGGYWCGSFPTERSMAAGGPIMFDLED